MKIVDVCGFYAAAGGGVRRYVDAKFAAAARAGHQLTVIAPAEKSRIEEREGGQVTWVASPVMPFDPRYRRFGARAAIWAAIDRAAPEVLEASSPWTSAEIAAAWTGQAKRSLVFHQDVVAAYAHTVLDGVLARSAIDALCAPWWLRIRRLSKRFDVTVTGGEWLAKRLGDHGVANAVTVPFGIEAGRFKPGLRDESLRAELLAKCGLGREAKLLLAVSRFHPEKRLPSVIAAVAQARRQRPGLGLAIVGHGLAQGSVQRAARKAGGIVLLGAVEHRQTLARIYASADLFVHGSAAETYGLAVGEAIASGLTVVAPAGGGAGDLARSGRSKLYRPGAPVDGSRAILEALGGKVDPPTAPPPGSLDEHFTALFALYERLPTAS
jgi:alpha-1,6-mannosyltransferase